MTKDFIIYLVVGLFLSGCANSKLNMELSIYKDDPLFKNVITQGDLVGVKTYLVDIESGLDTALKSQIDVAQASFDVYQQYWMAMGEALTLESEKPYNESVAQKQNDSLDGLKLRLNRYIDELNSKAMEVRSRLKRADATYSQLMILLPSRLKEIDFTESSYIGQLNRLQRIQETLSVEISKVHQAFSSLIEDTSHPFYQSTQARWGAIGNSLANPIFDKHIDERRKKALRDDLIEVAQLFRNVRSSLISLRPEISVQVDAAISTQQPEKLVTTMSNTQAIYEVSEQQISQMIASVDMLNSQLDRLQTASSPVWRIVTDPKNKNKWNKEFSKTYFYAEGNAGVVIVRDSPIKYRLQEASNNPAALVQAQLQVSRAVADAAFQIAGASTGVSLVTMSQDTGDNSPPKTIDNPNYLKETETIVAKKAKLAAKSSLFKRGLDAMAANIESYLRQLEKLESAASSRDRRNQDEINQLKLVIMDYLSAQQALISTAIIAEGI